MPESQLVEFGKFMFSQNWDKVLEGNNINNISQTFMNQVQGKVDTFFPLKNIRVPINQKPWFNHKVKELSQNKKKIFKKEGRSQKYKELVKQYNLIKQASIKKYVEKTTNDVSDPNKSNIHKILKKLGAKPGELTKPVFHLPEHDGFSKKDIANDLAKYFSNLSQEFAPLDYKLLPYIQIRDACNLRFGILVCHNLPTMKTD